MFGKDGCFVESFLHLRGCSGEPGFSPAVCTQWDGSWPLVPEMSFLAQTRFQNGRGMEKYGWLTFSSFLPKAVLSTRLQESMTPR